MEINAYEPTGFEGNLVSVEVDIRRGIPGIDLVGLAAGAVREARERVRVAVNNSGYVFPQDRVLINLAPADLPKEGAAYDLPIALAILVSAGILPDPGKAVLALGELTLDGHVRPVRGVLPAVAAGLSAGISVFIVAEKNHVEALAPGKGIIHSLSHLSEASDILERIRSCQSPVSTPVSLEREVIVEGDFCDLRGQSALKRALEVAAAGRHNVFMFGPPGSGKTMAAHRFRSLLPNLGEDEAIAAAAVRSLAGTFPCEAAVSLRPPFRAPHHTSTLEGMVGGGKTLRPGEISLAHHGVLFLDEAPEFRKDVLQSLREPIEDGTISIARAGISVRFPAEFQLLMAANPCMCGNLGRPGKACVCSPPELHRYWKKLGGPLLDRIDIRIPVQPVSPAELLSDAGESSANIRSRIALAIERQQSRFLSGGAGKTERNSEIPPSHISVFCELDVESRRTFETAVRKLGLSSRAGHSVLKVARTIADLEDHSRIESHDLLEAFQYRRYGEGESFWPG